MPVKNARFRSGYVHPELMLLTILKSKIHRATITQAELGYVGSITIDENLMRAANLREFEKVHVVNNNNGDRLETYVIKGKAGSGVICLNGAAARRGAVGDVIIIMAYAQMTPEEADEFEPAVAYPDASNHLKN